MQADQKRKKRESRTIEAMISLYCRDNHGKSGGLCPECLELLGYARARLDRCPFQRHKPTCNKCQTHCYKPDMREKIRRVMKYSGPRMLYRHPVLAFLHLLDARRKPPERIRPENSSGGHTA